MSRRWLLAAVGLGVLLRLGRYLIDAPLWWNEAFLAVNFLRRDYQGLLRPLDYNQVCPPLFAWGVKAAVDAFGFAEWSLRLLPLLAGLASVALLARLAWRLAPGRAAVLAVLLVAVAYHPIHLAAEVKPYSVDLLAALVILDLATAWRARPDRVGPIVVLIGIMPILLAASFPAVLVASATALVLLGVRGDRRLPTLLLGTIALNFAALHGLTLAAQQTAAARRGMAEYWREGFPASLGFLDVLRWFVTSHAGRMFAFPAGDGALASLGALALAGLGVVALWRAGRREEIVLLLGPFAATMGAALLGRYPYGGHPRIAQHLVPSLALLMSVGLDWLLAMVTSPLRRKRLTVALAATLVALGVVPLLREVAHPCRTPVEAEARRFARRFWPAVGQGAHVVCPRRDLGVLPWESADPDVALYLCNQAIYAPRHAKESRANPITRYVAFESPRIEAAALDGWIAERKRQGRLLATTTYRLASHAARGGRIVVYDFEAGHDD
jgi:4-amino-4-deoxy-L-arabinose transferase-like glycosyltransferase